MQSYKYIQLHLAFAERYVQEIFWILSLESKAKKPGND